MPSFRSPSVALETPEGWQDASTVVVLGPQDMGFKPSVVVAVNRDVLDPYLKRHVDIQAGEMQKNLPAFTLIARSETSKVPFGEVATLEFEWTSAEAGTRLHQYQLYALSKTVLYTLTATALSTRWHIFQRSLIDTVHSFEPRLWPTV